MLFPCINLIILLHHHSSLLLWHSHCMETAQYLRDKITEAGLTCRLNDLSCTVVLERPIDERRIRYISLWKNWSNVRRSMVGWPRQGRIVHWPSYRVVHGVEAMLHQQLLPSRKLVNQDTLSAERNNDRMEGYED